MKNRIQKLRENSLNAINCISHERAVLLTKFHKSSDAQGSSIPVTRALAFKYILENKFMCINDDELIVENRGENIMTKDQLLAMGDKYEEQIAADRAADAVFR